MEKNSVNEAAAKGNVSFLLKPLEEDALLLDRFMSSCYSETPLHIASMLGHVQFVDQILTRKPELAKELDSRKSSPLHLATAKDYLDIVKRLLHVNPDMCFECDRNGRNPVHIAAMKGHHSVLRELVQARPSAARVLMKRGETVLHGCVRYNQLEALKLLLETVADRELLNHKNYDGNSALHLAVADKQIGLTLTALDLVSKNESDIAKSLESVGAVRANDNDNPLSKKNELEEIIISISSSATTDPQNQAKHQKKHKKVSIWNRKKDNKKVVQNYTDWLERKNNALMVVASLMATIGFQAGVTPPNGFWQDDSHGTAGDSIMADYYPGLYSRFLAFNTTGFVASLSIILLLVSGLPFRRTIFMWILMVIMWVAITAMAFTYLFAISAYTPKHESNVLVKVLSAVLLVWMGLMLIMLLVHTVRLIIRMIKFLKKLFRRKGPSTSSVASDQLHVTV